MKVQCEYCSVWQMHEGVCSQCGAFLPAPPEEPVRPHIRTFMNHGQYTVATATGGYNVTSSDQAMVIMTTGSTGRW